MKSNHFESSSYKKWDVSEFLFFISICISLVNLGTKFFITANECNHAAEGTNACILGEPLQTGSHSLGKHRNRTLICKLHLELSCCGADLGDHNTSVVGVADDDSTDSIGDIVDIGHTIRHNQLVRHFLLSTHYHWVSTSDGNGSLPSRGDCLKSILNLVDTTIWRKYFH